MMIRTVIKTNCRPVETSTVQVLCVFPVATNVWSNIAIRLLLLLNPAALGRLSLLSHFRRRLPSPFHTRRGRGGSRNSPLSLISVIMPEKHNRTGDKNRRICSHNDAANQGERKTMQHGPAPDEQGDDRQERQTRSHDRPAQGLVDGLV